MKDSLRIHIQNLAAESIACYHECKEAFGCDFDSVMAELSADITLIQFRMEVSYAEATLMLIGTFPSQNGKNIGATSVKAAFCWHAFEFSEMERAMKELQH